MSCCCVKTLDYCKQDICGNAIDFDVLAQVEGIHKLVVDFMGIQVKVMAFFEVGDKIIFPTNLLNENYQYTGNITDPNGAKVVVRKNEIDYDCVKFQTVISLYSETGSATPPVIDFEDDEDTVVIEAVVDEEPIITGTTEIVEGIVDGSTTVTSAAFVGVRVIVIRGNIPIPGIDPLDGSNFFTKLLASDFITFSQPLVAGEFIRIQTIP